MTDQYTELRQALAALDAAPPMGNMATREEREAYCGEHGMAGMRVITASAKHAPDMLAEIDSLRAELAEARAEADECRDLRERMSAILTATANALKGDPPPLMLHDWSDLPAAAEALRHAAFGRNGLMALAAVRYCLGRMSYIVGDCCDWLRCAWPMLPESICKIIARDIDEAFKRDDEARERGDRHRPLGMDMDRAQWESVRALWGAERTQEPNP